MKVLVGILLSIALVGGAQAATVGVEFDYALLSNADGFTIYWGVNPDPAMWDRAGDRYDLGTIGDICDPLVPGQDPTKMACAPFGGGQSPDILPDLDRLYFVVTAYNVDFESTDSVTVYKDYTAPGPVENLRFNP